MKKEDKVVLDACIVEFEYEYDYDQSNFVLFCVSSTTHLEQWLFDSVCSFHMSPKRKWFFNFEDINGEIMYLANNKTCKVVRIDSIHLKNHDG